MKALVYSRYGSPDVLRLADVPVPEPRSDEVRIAVHTVSLNGTDMELLVGRPLYARMFGVFRPRRTILGSDVAGVVEAVGAEVTRFAPGDAVYADSFDRFGGLAERVCVKERTVVAKPDALSFEHACTLPQAGVLALQGIERDLCVEAGQRGLVIGAGGGVGTFAVQLAKHLGAEVTAVDGPAKVDALEALGADHVLDYTKDDFAARGPRFDFILDIAGRTSFFASERALEHGGRYAIVGGLLRNVFAALLLGRVYRLTKGKRMGILAWEQGPRDVEALAQRVVAGDVTPTIDGVFALEDAREGFARLLDGSALGKIVIRVA